MAVINCPMIQPINYVSSHPVTLAVDSSIIAVSYILFQDNKDGHHYLSRFGSITWTDRESHYSQAKLELYGLFWALHAVKV